LCVKKKGVGAIGSTKQGNLSKTNDHVAVQVRDLLFDNMDHEGVPYQDWIEAIGIHELEDLELTKEKIGSPGYI